MEVVQRAAAGPLDAYVSLTKPKAMLPHLVTTTSAMFLAVGSAPPLSILLLTLLGEGCAIAAANTLNCFLDRDIDALMARTRDRPLPSGLIKPSHALLFAAVMGSAGISILGGLVEPAAAILASIALLYYVIAYTFWLRRRTYWSSVACSAIGAIPPLIGWVAMTNRIEPTPLLLAAIIVFWTTPHFWALALFRKDDYARAGLRILPQRGVTTWIAASSVLLVAASLLLATAAGLGNVYLATACLLGTGLLYLNVRMHGPEPARAARRMYVYSILYVSLLFGSIIVDRIAQLA